jgi:hypothetical protein
MHTEAVLLQVEKCLNYISQSGRNTEYMHSFSVAYL